jgi:manganese transport protein
VTVAQHTAAGGARLMELDGPVPGTPAMDDLARRGRWRTAIALTGPAAVASVAYIDPGNFATNFAAGARHGYRLAWVVVFASIVAVLVQYLSSKVGLATGRSLPQLCAEVLPRGVNLVLWVQAELVAIATDLAEFVGAALGLHLLFGLPLFPAGLVSAVVSFGILALQRRGYRRFEVAIAAAVLVVAGAFGYLIGSAEHLDGAALVHGVTPGLLHGDALTLSVGIVGATVMPHVVYLHSALQARRISARTEAQRQTRLRYNRWDCIVGLGLAGVVNLSMLCVAAAMPSGRAAVGSGDLSLVHAALSDRIGDAAGVVFALALVAAGIGSASVGTYAGQVVMQGFMGWRLSLTVRRLVTMLPSLAVLALTSNVTGALVLSQVVLSFGVPFALVPLVLLTRRGDVMGTMVNRPATTVAIVAATVVIIGLNGYLLAGL